MSGGDIIGSDNGIGGAVLSTFAASDTLISIDLELDKLLADTCGTFLVHDVRNILVSEITKSRNNGVGSGLSKSAERVLLDVVAEVLELVDILESTLALDDLVKELKK